MPPVCFLYQICELCNAMFFSQLSYMWIMHRHGARHHICELSHAIFFSLRIPFVENLCILNYSSCVSAIWAGYGKIWSENKVFRAGNGTCWSIYLDGYKELLRGGFRDRWPVLYPTWGACSNLAAWYVVACCIWCLDCNSSNLVKLHVLVCLAYTLYLLIWHAFLYLVHSTSVY